MKIGILGFSGAGKKTVFQLLTGVDPIGKRGVVPGIAKVRDPRVDKLSAMYRPKSTKHAEIEFLCLPDVEIGATKGASWLSSVRDADALCVVLRDFDDPGVFHPHDDVNPSRDAAELETELILADLTLVETRLERIAKENRHGKEARLQKEAEVLETLKAHLEEEQPLRTMTWDDNAEATVKSLGFLSRRPLILVRNHDKDDAPSDAVTGFGGEPTTIAVNAKIELEVAAIDDPAERDEFLSELGIAEPAIAALTRTAYDAVGLISFFTVGPDEVRAWTIRRGQLAPQAAGKIHTDLERGFIRAEVVPHDKLLEAGSEAAAKSAGAWGLKGKDYVVLDGDVMNIRFSV